MENLGLNKQQADALVEKYITNPITKLHSIESEEIMKALARKFGEDEEAWGIIGLLHDIDWDLVKDDTMQHCVKAVSILKEAGAKDFLIEMIQSHGYGMELIPALKDKVRITRLEHSLVAAETLTGLIFASALMQPDKKLSSVNPASLKKKFKNKKFAERCNRGLILECEKAGVPLDEFLQLGLEALQRISDKLGL
ncbi:MAG: HDIG domain-containing protein [Candidatus Pacebacteria bacterium]|nr:HDIG domain-containing protein [Candidatus Paceibacterota bacterium]MDR3583460.1 HDIG domain-containing protein [Candidatus Paceibacterota bacterium]